MRRSCTFLLVCTLVGTALAQSDRVFKGGREGDLDQWLAAQAQRNRSLSEGEKAVRAVSAAVSRGDCVAAASALNAGLAKSHPEVWLLAGAMFEEGLCLKASWERALNFYQRADGAGQPSAAARLAAGYATPAGGRDLAASLWWAARAKTALPGPCAQAAPLAGDPDRFIATLKGWPAGQVESCAYAGAVMSAVQGELAAPDLAASLGLEGTIRIAFVPAESRLDFSDDLVAAGGLVADASTRDADARATRTALQEHLRQTADRALKRHAKPGAVPASWRVEAQHALRVAR